LPLRALQAFEAAARHLSFSRAAKELHVTPAAISQQIKLLEDQIGQSLFERGPVLRLNALAATVSRRLCEALDMLEQVSQQLRASQTGRPLVVSLPPSFASRWLIPRLERFSARHPDIELHLQATTRTVDFETEDVDVAVRYGGGHYPGLQVERLRAETVVAIAHPRLAVGLLQPSDLLGTTLLHNTGLSWDPTFPDWPTWLRNVGVVPQAPLRIRQFDEANMVIEAALAGLGVALVWRTLVNEELMSGRMVALFEEQPLANAYHFVCPPERLALPRVAAFRQWLLDELSG
jgi:LysR family glycine cleavage system transcriptional activator